MTELPLMPKATAVWLVDNTTLTFRQVADFCGLHELEVAGIADGEVAIGIKGLDPVANNQVTAEDIKRCEADPVARLKLLHREVAPPQKRKGPRYTPVSKRQDRPSAIAWLVRYHPELEDSQIGKLVGTTKPTIQSIRNRTHWNIANIQPVDPVALGLCKQMDLDAVVRKAAEKKAKAQQPVPTPEERISLMSTDQSLSMPEEPAAPHRLAEFENFSLDDPRGGEEEDKHAKVDADSLFNLPKGGADDDEED
ncbi:MAG TPA: cell cycle transcriptional regulator TrcR [Thermohalobaculum sp.]|nr:cell cycle transcriptional regulator TrcR [Thermohalobaculum sp.]